MARSYPGVGGAGAGGGGPGAGKMTRASQFSNFHIDTVGTDYKLPLIEHYTFPRR